MIHLLSTLLFLQTQPLTNGAQQTPTAKTITPKQAQAVAQKSQGSSSVMILDPKSRAADYQEAFNLLKAEKSTAKVIFHLNDGQQISNVIDMKMMPNNTIVVFRYNSPQGVMLQAVEIEAIDSIKLQ